MFHAGGHQGARGRSSALGRGGHPHFFGHHDWKVPLRCGILFCTFSCVLFVIGVILTWLGIHNIFGESVPITGPILLSVGTLMLLLASRQFYMAHKRKKLQKAKKSKETTAAVDNDDGMGNATAGMDSIKEKPYDEVIKEEDDEYGQTPLMDIKLPKSPPLEPGTYIWPPLPAQNPYTSMAMMLYKDPAMMYGPFLAKQAYPLATPSSTSGTGSVPDGMAASSSIVDQSAPPGAEASAPLLQSPEDQDSLSQTPNLQAATPVDSNIVQTPCQVAFPKERNEGLPAVVATAGISNLPNRTAFMMLTTIELQETI